MARKYDPVWELLKTTGKVELAVPIPLHKTVMRGVINCKDRDAVFKYLAEQKKIKHIISYQSEQAKITVTLKEYPALDTLSVCDL